MKSKLYLRLLLGIFGAFLSAAVIAAPRTLIELKNGKPTPGLAKSWTKVKVGQYNFVLDQTKEIKKGVTVTPAAVKSTLEAKLGTTFGVKVSPKGKGEVTVNYKGDEQKFLTKLSRTKIRAKKSVNLALESSVSDGGIRAKTADRPPKEGEVKGIVVRIKGDMITVKITDSKNEKLTAGSTAVIEGVKDKKLNEKVYFKPTKKVALVWAFEKGSLK